MTETIQKALEQIEREHNVRILYAVESGSRAWGFASPDSDYDVRYIYVRPMEDYLRIDPLKDTIEGPLDDILDFSGWDIRKTLELLRKTNPSLMEWIQSPIVYKTTPIWEQISRDFPRFFNPFANMQNYVSMASNNWKDDLNTEQVKLKKYLYVLRALLCCHWLEKFGSAPPVPFDTLCRAVLPEELKSTVAELLARKKNVHETGLTDHIPELDHFIIPELKRLKQGDFQVPRIPPLDWSILNTMFREVLSQTEALF